MDVETGLVLSGIVLCLFVLAFTSAVDAAMTAIGRHRLGLLHETDARRAQVIDRLLAEPYRFKATVLLLNSAATITATALTLRLFDAQTWQWRVAALVGLLLFILIFSEALPKALAIRNPSATARLLAGPMAFSARLLAPFIWIIGAVTGPFVRVASGQTLSPMPLVTEEELRMLVNVGEEEGLIEPDEREMIEGIFSFGDTTVREVMIPRVDIVALEETASIDEALNVIIRTGHSRIPVYRETIDHIVGILYAKDLLLWLRSGQRDASIGALLRTAHFVPDTMKVDALLKDLQARKVHLAIVVDEYGGTAGLITIEDVIEEIVGEIQDEYDVDEQPIRELGPGDLEVDARVPIDDVNDLTGLRLVSEESDRIGGIVFERLGRVPKVGDTVQVADGVTIAVLSMDGLRLRKLRLQYRLPQEDEVHATRSEDQDNE
ncbi:MAG: hemolysin family protein [Roseiflexus sp.]|nr:hemolysin family protein [Roseiflexus sp.]MCS7291065.1 hemolysin family protein [Roseiflexus sp.]MDW8145806.1 hemolysin family protein [Roseiflexaceae bacterium]MDW8232950.1 hemolysin family protein [Roseiflexaceae bacterium]